MEQEFTAAHPEVQWYVIFLHECVCKPVEMSLLRELKGNIARADKFQEVHTEIGKAKEKYDSINMLGVLLCLNLHVLFHISLNTFCGYNWFE